MKTRMIWALSIVSAGADPGGALAGGPPPCAFGGCYVNPGTCVVTDKVTLAALTVDAVLSCPRTLGVYCTGGNGTNGIAPNPAGSCGLSFLTDNATTPAVALNSLDHRWLQSTTTPKVVDFGSKVNSVFVFPAVDHGPFPEEGIESTVWGSDACDLCAFPSGWTLGTLTTIWKKGWEDPVACQGQDNADDFTGQYSFPGAGFRFIAVAANFSISIFNDPTHTTWESSADNSTVPGWQSFDDEIDAVGTPVCDPGDVVADAGPDQTAPAGVGAKVCFDGSGSVAAGGIATIGWDLNGDSAIDTTGPEACIPCDSIKSGEVTLFVTDTCGCVDSDKAKFDCNDPTNRVSISEKGSLLYYSKIELKWSCADAPLVCTPIQDTFLTIVNDFPVSVFVQWYFINGDAPTAAVFAGSPPALVERAHKGWNQVDCTTELSANKTTYMSALTGGPLGCQPFRVLDSGPPVGRPDPENPGQRIVRGYAIAFAVDRATGDELSWNHLSGHVDIVDYANRSAWEYNTYAFQCLADSVSGDLCGHDPGSLHMNGTEYDYAFDKLLFDFYAVGSVAFSLPPTTTVQLDTDLTLYPVSVDLRTTSTNTDGPVLTRAKFDIWNENEDAQSGVNRCITCWDQTLLSNYAESNSFLIANLQTNKGKARIDGIASDSCDAPGACCDLNDDPDCNAVDFRRGTIDRDCSEDAALLGVSDKILAFSGAVTGRTDAGMTLVGQGTEAATIRNEIIPRCGDGEVNQPGEECDDRNNDACDGCSPDCTPEFCGDGVCQCGEDTCTCPADCGPSCGNGACDCGEDSGTCPVDCVPFFCCTFAGCIDDVDPSLCEGTVGVGTCADFPSCQPRFCCTFAGCVDRVDPNLCEGTVGLGTCADFPSCQPRSCCTCAGCIDGVDPNLCDGIVFLGACADVDCRPPCGNGACDCGENSCTCPDDCGQSCGNGVCDCAEDVFSCFEDCAVIGPP